MNKLNRAIAAKRNKNEINKFDDEINKKIYSSMNKLQLHFNNNDHTNKLS